MKISYRWITEHLNYSTTPKQLADDLTMLGLEVGGVEDISANFSEVYIAEVTDVQQHPNANKLNLCQVFDGNITQEVICGATNVRKGLKVAFAKIGALLPDNFKIKKSKIRGVVSNGMICSARELGLGNEHDGIMELAEDAPIGTLFSDFLDLQDYIFDLELTPNRGDCFSLTGVLRELQVKYQLPATDYQYTLPSPQHTQTIPVTITNPDACPYFCGIVLTDVDGSTATPKWMVEVLEKSGIRAISWLVDLTNYVMLELGQPLHAYDLSLIDKNIVVRNAHQGEQCTLLDGASVELSEDYLLITTENTATDNRSIGLAGIMGGDSSGVSESTTAIFLEAAHFTPQYILGKARQFGIQSEASIRFERGVDYKLPTVAIRRCVELICQINPEAKIGELVETQTAQYKTLLDPATTPTVSLSLEEINKRLGVTVTAEFCETIFRGLEIKVTSTEQPQTWQLTSPSHRYDLAIKEDYIEEVARFYGYAKFLNTDQQKTHQVAKKSTQQQHTNKLSKRNVKKHLASLGLTEVITYSFIDEKLQNILYPEIDPCRLLNPISSDMNVMRYRILPGLLQVAAYNLNHQQSNCALFELGLCFNLESGTQPTELANIQQNNYLAGLICNSFKPRHWRENKPVDFYLIKGIVESVLSMTALNNRISYQTENLPHFMHPGQSAVILDGTKPIGLLGMLHPGIAERIEIPAQTGLFGLDWAHLTEHPLTRQFQPFSPYPKVVRDFAVIVDEKVSSKQLTSHVQSLRIKYLININIFDNFQGDPVPQGYKSVGLCFTFQSEHTTLKDAQVNNAMQKIENSMHQQYTITIRK